MITRQVQAEGATRIAVVSDEPGKYPIGADFAHDVTFHHRDDLDALQRDLRNISTTVPEGSRATAGIGCHYMAIWMDRDTATFTHMGAEGANWIGQACRL